MKKVTALLTVLSVCVCLGVGCAAGTAQTGKPSVPNENADVKESADAKEEANIEEPDGKNDVTADDETVNEVPEQTDHAGEKKPVELIVFAAASMTETMEQIADVYSEAVPNVTITYNFDSSGTLKTQIEEGADCDIFISASPKQMNQLDITADPEVNTDGLDLVDRDTRFNLLENRVVLAVPEGNPGNIKSYDELADALKSKDVMLAIGNEDVPVGQYTQKIFEYYGLDEDTLNRDGVLTYGSNVKEVTTQVSEAAVDCGIIYSTDAFSAGLTVEDMATKEMCGQVIYPAAVLKISKHPEEAKDFLDFLTSERCCEIFENVGFTCLK